MKNKVSHSSTWLAKIILAFAVLISVYGILTLNHSVLKVGMTHHQAQTAIRQLACTDNTSASSAQFSKSDPDTGEQVFPWPKPQILAFPDSKLIRILYYVPMEHQYKSYEEYQNAKPLPLADWLISSIEVTDNYVDKFRNNYQHVQMINLARYRLVYYAAGMLYLMGIVLWGINRPKQRN